MSKASVPVAKPKYKAKNTIIYGGGKMVSPGQIIDDFTQLEVKQLMADDAIVEVRESALVEVTTKSTDDLDND